MVVHTGDALIMWGGRNNTVAFDDGAVWDEGAESWSPISATSAPPAKFAGHAAVWDDTAGEMLIWDGEVGARYDPGEDAWTSMPAAPLSARSGFAWAWHDAGRRLYVFSGVVGVLTYGDDGAYYDAAANEWTMLPNAPNGFSGRAQSMGAFVGGRFVFWGGTLGLSGYASDGLSYDPEEDAFTLIVNSPLTARWRSAVAARGDEMFFWGGEAQGVGNEGTGAIYDATQGTWTMLPASPLSPRQQAAAVWTGTQYLVWGGKGEVGADIESLDDGASFTP